MHVFFDLDDTLYNHRDAQAHAVRAWRRHHLPNTNWSDAELVAVWENATFRHYRTFERGLISFREQQRRRIRDVVQDRVLSDETAEELFAAYQPHYEEYWSLFEDVPSALERLKGIPVGILAHGDPDQQRRKLENFGLLQHFNPIIIIDEFGIRKPSKEFFEKAQRAVGLPAEECVYVGDHLQLDALGAKNAGWRGFWLERSGAFTADFGIEVIRGLSKLPDALGV
jgi:putative hydrolase of the HAD superfamily